MKRLIRFFRRPAPPAPTPPPFVVPTFDWDNPGRGVRL